MSLTNPSQPSMRDIGTSQNEEVNLRRYLAAGHFYRRAKWLHFGGASLAIAFALASPIVLVFAPDSGPLLGAIAAAWIFTSRLVLEPFKRDFQERGATAQERFDTAVLGLGWNNALTRPPSEEEIRAASGSMKGVDEVRDWYPTGEESDWPVSVLVCQRANTVWARRQHRAYGRVLAGAAALWAVIGVVVAVADGASLADYLVTVALPSLPALLDATEFSRTHAKAADERQLLEDQTDGLLRRGTATAQELREIQDQLFNLRRNAPLVPRWFYKLVRPTFEQDMHYAARQTAGRSDARRPGAGSE